MVSFAHFSQGRGSFMRLVSTISGAECIMLPMDFVLVMRRFRMFL
jgi:hypothetical protein